MEHALIILTESMPELIGTFIDLAQCMIEGAKIDGGVCVTLDVLEKLNEAGGKK